MPAEVKMRKVGGQGVYLTLSPETDRGGEAPSPLLSDVYTSERSGCAQLHSGNRIDLCVGHAFSSLRSGERARNCVLSALLGAPVTGLGSLGKI